MAVLRKRMERFGLTLHPDKTRLLPFGVRQRHSRAARVRPPSTSWGSRAIGGEPGGVAGGWGARRGVRACDGPSRPSTTGADAIGTSRSRRSTPRSASACKATINYFGVNGNLRSLLRLLVEARSGPGTSGCAVAASARASTWERFTESCCSGFLSRAPGSSVRSGA